MTHISSVLCSSQKDMGRTGTQSMFLSICVNTASSQILDAVGVCYPHGGNSTSRKHNTYELSHGIAFTGEVMTQTINYQLGNEVVAGVVRQKASKARWARWTSNLRQQSCLYGLTGPTERCSSSDAFWFTATKLRAESSALCFVVLV